MIHNNGAFPAIKGNPTTNYCITADDEVREKFTEQVQGFPVRAGPPHELYLGERAASITIGK